jgi:hypothetical protein
VDVDPAGRDDAARGVDLATRRTGRAADLRQSIAVDRDVARTRGGATAVHDRSTTDHEVMHGTIVARPAALAQALPSFCDGGRLP